MVLMDDSNLWIEGKRLAAERDGLMIDSNPIWRINHERLMEAVLKGYSAFIGGQLKTTAPRKHVLKRVFVSVPSDAAEDKAYTDAVYRRFSQQGIDVDISARSRFTGREKMVDHKFVRVMSQDIACLTLAKKELLKDRIPVDRTYCLIAGDGDYVDLVHNALDMGFPVEIWFWRSNISERYNDLKREYSELLRIVQLNEYLSYNGPEYLPGTDLIGLMDDRFDRRKQIPPDLSFVVICHRRKSTQKWRSLVSNVIKIARIPVRTVLNNQTAVFVCAERVTPEKYRTVIRRKEQAVSLVRNYLLDSLQSTSADIEVMNYEEYQALGTSSRTLSFMMLSVDDDIEDENSENEDDGDAPPGESMERSSAIRGMRPYVGRGSSIGRSSGDGAGYSFACGASRTTLFNDGASSSWQIQDLDPSNDPRQAGTSQLVAIEEFESDNEGFQTVLRRQRRTNLRQTCKHWEFCKHGLECQFRHTGEEKEFFREHGGKSPYAIKKVHRCKRSACRSTHRFSERNRQTCSYLHDGEFRLCYKCLGTNCETINPYDGDACTKVHRGIISAGRLQELIEANYIAVVES